MSKPQASDVPAQPWQSIAAQNMVYDRVWYWRSKLPERKGEPCRVLARGQMNSALVEFADGFRVITSRYAIRRHCGDRVAAGISAQQHSQTTTASTPRQRS